MDFQKKPSPPPLSPPRALPTAQAGSPPSPCSVPFFCGGRRHQGGVSPATSSPQEQCKFHPQAHTCTHNPSSHPGEAAAVGADCPKFCLVPAPQCSSTSSAPSLTGFGILTDGSWHSTCCHTPATGGWWFLMPTQAQCPQEEPPPLPRQLLHCITQTWILLHDAALGLS